MQDVEVPKPPKKRSTILGLLSGAAGLVLNIIHNAPALDLKTIGATALVIVGGILTSLGGSLKPSN